MPLHKIPLCNFKYVGDNISSGTFIYKNEEEISKHTNLFVQKTEHTSIDIVKTNYLECINKKDLNKNRTIKLQSCRLFDLNKHEELSLSCKDDITITLNDDIKLLNKFKQWDINTSHVNYFEKDYKTDIVYINDIHLLDRPNIDYIFIDNVHLLNKYTSNDIIINNYNLVDKKYININKKQEEFQVFDINNRPIDINDDDSNFIEKTFKDIKHETKNVFIQKKYKNIFNNNNENLMQKSFTTFFKSNNKVLLETTYIDILNSNKLYFIENYNKKNTSSINNNILIEKTFKNSYDNIYDLSLLWKTHSSNKNILKQDKIILLNQDEKIKRICNIDNTKRLDISIKDIVNVKTYKEMSNHLKDIKKSKGELIAKYSKDINTQDIDLLERRKKDTNKVNNNKFINKIYKLTSKKDENKLIENTYVNINQDINDKNVEKLKQNIINKNENKELQNNYITNINVDYNVLLEKGIPTGEIFKQNNSLLDTIINKKDVIKENNYLTQHIYQNNIVHHKLNMLFHLKQFNLYKESAINLNKKYKYIYYRNYKNLEKCKKDIYTRNITSYTEVTERWWVLNPNAPFDRKILPFDYNYSKMPLVSKDNVMNTTKVMDKHPISFAPYMIDSGNGGKDLDIGTKEIDVSIEIMIDMVNIVGMIILQEVKKFQHCTGQEALEFILELLFDWLNMDSTIRKMKENNSREHYLRCYRWIRWEAEQLWFEADEDHTIFKNLGVKFTGALLGKLIEYMKYHHFNIVPFWRNLKFMDIERQFNGAKNGDIFKDVDKIKSNRHYVINTQITTKQHLFQNNK